MSKTLSDHAQIIKRSRDIFVAKHEVYGDAWREMRYMSLITQLKIKLLRILNEKSDTIHSIPASTIDQLQDIVNYAVFAVLHQDGRP